MESKQRKISYGATCKRKVIVYAEKRGNRKAGKEFNVAESNGNEDDVLWNDTEDDGKRGNESTSSGHNSDHSNAW